MNKTTRAAANTDLLEAEQEGEKERLNSMLGTSVRMRLVRAMIDRIAPTDATVLVWGESGVGKELVARALHQESSRRNRPFVKVNCAALPLELLESELFGYERGAFTGAVRQKPGKFELAHTGTIFLDEIGEIALPLQAKLLQVLQDMEFSPLGSNQDVRVDVRVIAATNKNLIDLVERGVFREDLYYRLNVMSIHVPPLRERRDEIPALAARFMEEFGSQYGRPPRPLSAPALSRFLEYHWPGNVRELENVVKRIVVMGNDDFVAEELVPRALPSAEPLAPGTGGVELHVASARTPETSGSVWREGLGLREIARRAAEEAEGTALQEVLDRVHWHRLEAARRLQVSYKTLLTKMKLHGLH
jgi:transcriptional regulator with PAS, ATPase and Fis domain